MQLQPRNVAGLSLFVFFIFINFQIVKQLDTVYFLDPVICPGLPQLV